MITNNTKVEHIEEAVGAVDVKLDADEIKRLEAGYAPHPVLGHQ
jgi:aryl-alcohol dehydrogenase-like predicted oxidoreductase